MSTQCCQPFASTSILDGTGNHVLAVADDLGVGLRRGHGGTRHARVAVMQAALAVVGVHEAGCAGVDRRERLVVMSVRMPIAVTTPRASRAAQYSQAPGFSAARALFTMRPPAFSCQPSNTSTSGTMR